MILDSCQFPHYIRFDSLHVRPLLESSHSHRHENKRQLLLTYSRLRPERHRGADRLHPHPAPCGCAVPPVHPRSAARVHRRRAMQNQWIQRMRRSRSATRTVTRWSALQALATGIPSCAQPLPCARCASLGFPWLLRSCALRMKFQAHACTKTIVPVQCAG